MNDRQFVISEEDCLEALKREGQESDEAFDLFEASLLLALMNHEGISADQYRNHIHKLVESATEEVARLEKEGLEDGLDLRLSVLRNVIYRITGYQGEHKEYDYIEHMDMIRVIERRAGIPVALGVLILSLCERLGWNAWGISFPAHFLITLDVSGQRIILDPFDMLSELDAPAMRALIKKHMGERAELSAEYYQSISKRDVLIRLQNNIKFRQIEAEDYKGALKTVELMQVFAPHEYKLYFDEGILHARLDNPQRAVEALGRYIEHCPDGPDKWQAQDIMHDLSSSL